MSIDELTDALITAGIPVAFAVFVWLRRELRWIPWTRPAAVIAAASGIGAASLSFIASRANALDLTRPSYFLLLGSKHTLNGVFAGIVICVLLSKPWTKHPNKFSLSAT
jgi:hypothetical protein